MFGVISCMRLGWNASRGVRYRPISALIKIDSGMFTPMAFAARELIMSLN